MLFCVLVLCVIIPQVLTGEPQNGVPPCRKRQSNFCVLPPHPDNGIYEVSNVPDARPGQIFESLVLTVYCRRGYGVVESTDESGVTSSNKVYCINGIWLQNMPKCERFCRLDPDPSVRYMCHIPNSNGYKPCDEYVAPGTSVGPVCNSPIYYSVESLLYMKCTAGAWDYVAKCKPECGRETPQGEQLIIDGGQAKRGELPWHVAVYRKTSKFNKLICGGSLIANNVVISAAHCFWHDAQKKLAAPGFAVAIGKLYRRWNDERDVEAQKSDVKEIMIPRLFDGEAANFQEDIAIVVLVTPFVYKTYVRPVCLNFDANFDSYQLRQGKLGKVAGWGYTEVNGNASQLLKVVELPFINADTCIDTLPPSFREYITGDKFCAGYTNGTALCRGDSGGGLAFADRELGIDRYYLRGVVSASPRNDDKICNDEVYTAFTKITKHEEFIKRSVAASTKKSCSSYQFQCDDGACVDIGAECNKIWDCIDGSDESEYLCSPQTSSRTIQKQSGVCVLPPYPHHGTYTVTSLSDARPGQVLDSFLLTVTCDEGYGILAVVANGTSDESKAQVFCVNGTWYQRMPSCIAFCKVKPDRSIRYVSCQVPGSNGTSTCQGYVPPGTGIIPTCNTPNYYSTDDFPFMKCVNGSWNYIAKCQPECGRVTPQGERRMVEEAKPGNIPWHVSIYKKTSEPYMLICSGSLIANNIVLSNAHCFANDDKKLLPSEYAVAAGKIYRSWDDERDVHVQKSDIKEINTSNVNPSDVSASSHGDIAVLILTTPLEFNAFITAVCLDLHSNNMFSLGFSYFQDQVGKAGGWGVSSSVLQEIQLENMTSKDCHKGRWLGLSYLIALDFCAAYVNDSIALCKGDSGSGLAFPKLVEGIEKYYLRAIVSITPTTQDAACIPELPVWFNSISTPLRRYQSFINKYLSSNN